MPEVGQMDPKLMFPAGLGLKLEKAEPLPGDFHTLRDPITGRGRLSVGPDTVLDGDDAGFVTAQRSHDFPRIIRRMAMDPGLVVLLHPALLEEPAESSGGASRFGNQDDAAGFAVQPVDQPGFPTTRSIQAHPRNQAGPLVGLGRMTDEARRLVDGHEVRYFAQDLDPRMTGALGGRSGRRVEHHLARCLSVGGPRVSSAPVKGKIVIHTLLLLVLAATRYPGLLPANFSAVYAMAFCSGLFFRGRWDWLLPMAVLMASDIALNLFYQRTNPGMDAFSGSALGYLLCNYAGYAALFGLGRIFKPRQWIGSLVAGSVLGAVLFYLITNTAAYLVNPFGNAEYAVKSLAGWIAALTKGVGGYPETWTFFRNTLLSSGLFSALMIVTARITEPAEEPADAPEASEVDGEPETEAAK